MYIDLTFLIMCCLKLVLPVLCITVNGENVTGTFVGEVGQEYTIECVAYGGRPSVNLTWEKYKKPNNIENTIVSVNAFNEDTVDTKLSLEDTRYGKGDYNITCSSFGRYPEQEAAFTLFIKIHDIAQPKRWWIFMILPLTFALFLLVVLRVAYRHRIQNLDTDNLRSDPRNYETPGILPINTYGEDGFNLLPSIRTHRQGSDEEEELTTDVKRDEISMMTTLPGRSYLQYFKGYFTRSEKTRYIIVKTVKEQAYVKDMYTFVKCCNLMQYLPRQESIVTLLGISVGEMPVYSYHEYVEGLTLRDYMLRNFQSSLNTTSTTLSHSIGKDASISNKALYAFAEDVANGMDFLVSHNFSHPALSTRKVLLKTDGRCKLYDIWPDVLVLERIKYLLNRESPPLAWMAPECIFLGQYHPKTDVWSYGVLLWELFSFGETPYYTMNNSEIEQELRNSKLLAIPPNCPGSIFSVMLSSWNKEWEQRPTFKEILHKMRCLLRGFEQDEKHDSAVSQEISPPKAEYFTLEKSYSEM
ncbi:Fibroblast growth factor receptor 4 [Holothuria leucospilota]|uniref:Fibroblast growth factor receptor 4 n=1 Tax=Holothuria leucospilota TaxID=206669 RepID=A0A9Q1BYR7_HOLLE|nr:Fibroblast growth factor receptor 4 [Holothuria leucospilota]